MLLAIDVGGTKTLVGVFAPGSPRPNAIRIATFRTLDFDSLDAVIDAFLTETKTASIVALCAGAAGPVVDGTVQLTNVPWTVDVRAASAKLGDCPSDVINDLEATAYGVVALRPDEMRVLQEGMPVAGANAAIIAAGTGLGEALVIDVNGRAIPRATEAGHADFAARTPRELELVAALVHDYGRVSVEHVLSGPGLARLFRFTHVGQACAASNGVVADEDLPARVSENALAGSCANCVTALEIFVEAYGAEAGNLALRSLARAGVYVAGGIAPKILPALERGTFIEAFRFKPPMDDLLRSIPVRVVLNEETALLGAAVRAGQIARGR